MVDFQRLLEVTDAPIFEIPPFFQIPPISYLEVSTSKDILSIYDLTIIDTHNNNNTFIMMQLLSPPHMRLINDVADRLNLLSNRQTIIENGHMTTQRSIKEQSSSHNGQCRTQFLLLSMQLDALNTRQVAYEAAMNKRMEALEKSHTIHSVMVAINKSSMDERIASIACQVSHHDAHICQMRGVSTSQQYDECTHGAIEYKTAVDAGKFDFAAIMRQPPPPPIIVLNLDAMECNSPVSYSPTDPVCSFTPPVYTPTDSDTTN